jgi:hypothetical protein
MFKDRDRDGEMFFVGSAFANASNEAVSVHVVSGGITIEVGRKQPNKNSGYVILEYTKKQIAKQEGGVKKVKSHSKELKDELTANTILSKTKKIKSVMVK